MLKPIRKHFAICLHMDTHLALYFIVFEEEKGMSRKFLIIGGVAGGATTATKLRRLDEHAEIIMFERGEHISFANCGLPYHVGGVIEERDELLLQSVERMKDRYNVEVRNFTEVIQINRENKTVIVKNLQTAEEYTENYDVLILSPGAQPIVPPIDGLKSNNVFTLRNIPDMDQITSYIEKNKPNKAAVIGAGFIGLEMAENLAMLDIDVTLVEKANQVMAPLDIEMAACVQKELTEHGVNVILNDGISDVENAGKTIILESGKMIETDMIILAIGVRPENNLAEDAGLDIGERGGIKVNEYMQTSDPAIYALGDAIEITDYINGKPTMIPLAWPANRQAHVVAHHIDGKKITYPGTLGTSVVKIFDITAASTGNNEKILQRFNIPYEVVHIYPLSHAGYYPGAEPVNLKLIFDEKTGKIFGAQAIGKSGVDKRIDVLATAIRGGLTVYDLQELELAYAPPFSSAKDPVNMVGYVAANVIDGRMGIVQWHEIDQIIQTGATVIDVRREEEFAEGHIAGTINIPVDELRHRLDEIKKDDTIYLVCRVGERGYLASRILEQNGYRTKNLTGGVTTYFTMKENLPK